MGTGEWWHEERLWRRWSPWSLGGMGRRAGEAEERDRSERSQGRVDELWKLTMGTFQTNTESMTYIFSMESYESRLKVMKAA